MRRMLLAISILVSCASSEPQSISETVLIQSSSEMVSTFRPRPSRIKVTEDPYENWNSWCQNLNYPACEFVAECPSGPEGTQMTCVQPWWSKAEGSNVKVCTPAFPNRKEQKEKREKLRSLIEELCEPPRWWKPGHKIGYCWKHKQGGTCNRMCNPDSLDRFLSLIASRESTWRPWKAHNLNPDIKAALLAWERRKSVFSDNPYFHERNRWRGWGLYGMNSALFVDAWDPKAPPEILCKEVEATIIATRRLKQAWNKYKSGISCDGQMYYGEAQELDSEGEFVRYLPSWTDLHRAIWNGSLCPSNSDSAFVKRTKSFNLDPGEPVTMEMLGKEINRDRQNTIAKELFAKLYPN